MAEPGAVPGTDGESIERPGLLLAWLVLLALPLLCRLGAAPLFDVDEGAFSEATREMLVSRDWWHTTLDGAPRFDKPIGVYWVMAACAWLFGLNEFALRLPSAVAAWGMALALSIFAARRWGRAEGALAGALCVTSLGVQLIGRAATADGLLNLLLVLAGLDLWRHIETGARAPLRRAYAWVALGLLVKGPIAALVPGAAFMLWCATTSRWDTLRRAALDAPGWVLLAAIAGPWYVYALHRHGMAFAEGFLLRHNVERFTSTISGHRGSLLYYVAVLPIISMPWTPLLVATVLRVRPLWADPLTRYLLCWSGFVLVFFSLSGTKLPHYVLYGYAPLVLLMARTLARASRRLLAAQALAMFTWAAVAAVLPYVVLRFAPGVRDPLYRDLLAGAPAPALLPGAVLVAAVLALVIAGHVRRAAWRAPVAASALISLYIAAVLLPWFGEALQGPVRRAGELASTYAGAAVQWQVHLPSFSVYRRQETPVREPQPQDMVLTRRDRMQGEDAGRPLLLDERGVVLLGPRPPMGSN